MLSLALAVLVLPRGAAAVSPCDPGPGGRVFYVRTCAAANQSQCNDANSGASPTSAWATITRAADKIKADGNGGDLVIVGPGVYREGNISIERSGVSVCPSPGAGNECQPRPITFLGDASGVCTGGGAGPVRIEVPNDEPLRQTGFLVFGASDIVISGFQITLADDAAVQIRPGRFGAKSERVVVANNELFWNTRGVQVMDSNAPLIFNNLLYRNTTTGISLQSTPNGRVINNTLHDHVNGLVIAKNPTGLNIPSPGAWVINNVFAASIIFSIDIDQSSTCDYIGAYNLLESATGTSPYSDKSPRDRSDIRVPDAGLVAPEDGDFRLGAGNPGIDGGSAPVEVLGLQDSSARFDGAVDAGVVDVGYHQGHVGYPILPLPPVTTQFLYVSSDGDDLNSGVAPDQALRTIGGAMDIARAVSRIIVGPGVYRESVTFPTRRPAGPVELIGDNTGDLTGRAPGLVVVDAAERENGFGVLGHCSTVIDGFAIKGAKENGIFLNLSNRTVVRNNMMLSNGRVGIRVAQSDEVQIVNNLVYSNGDKRRRIGGGIQIGNGDGAGSNNALIQNNTVYGNGVDGLLIGSAAELSRGTRVRYNIFADNGGNGLQINNNSHAGASTDGLCVEFNVNPHGYGPVLPANCATCLDTSSRGTCAGAPCRGTRAGCLMDPPSDLKVDPRFVQPVSGRDGCLAQGRFWDDSFRLQQRAASQDTDSPAVDFSIETAAFLGLDGRTTRTDSVGDLGNVDAGYHYVAAAPANVPIFTGDCDHDGRVSVSELVQGVNIALARLPLIACKEFDANGDGTVDISELTEAVSEAMACGR